MQRQLYTAHQRWDLDRSEVVGVFGHLANETRSWPTELVRLTLICRPGCKLVYKVSNAAGGGNKTVYQFGVTVTETKTWVN